MRKNLTIYHPLPLGVLGMKVFLDISKLLTMRVISCILIKTGAVRKRQLLFFYQNNFIKLSSPSIPLSKSL